MCPEEKTMCRKCGKKNQAPASSARGDPEEFIYTCHRRDGSAIGRVSNDLEQTGFVLGFCILFETAETERTNWFCCDRLSFVQIDRQFSCLAFHSST